MDRILQELITPQLNQDTETVGAAIQKKELDDITQMLIDQTPEDLQLIKSMLEHGRSKRIFEEELEFMSVSTAINSWLNNSDFTPETKKNYEYYIGDMKTRGIIPELNDAGKPYTLGEFRLNNHVANINHINQIKNWSESTRQLRISCYASLTSYLARISNGWFRKVILPINAHSAYYDAHNTRTVKALTLSEWQHFIAALYTLDSRDSLIARCLLYNTAINAVLNLTLPQINFETYTIEFKSSTGKKNVVTYPAPFIQELQDYIKTTTQNRADSEMVFVTRNGNNVVRSRCNYSFLRASIMAKTKRVSPYTIRATFLTLVKGEGVDSSQLLLIPKTGTNK